MSDHPAFQRWLEGFDDKTTRRMSGAEYVIALEAFNLGLRTGREEAAAVQVRQEFFVTNYGSFNPTPRGSS